MRIPIVIETLPNNRFRAKSTAEFPLVVEANTPEESLRIWRERYASVLPSDAELVAVEPSVCDAHPFAKFIGTQKNDRLVELWRDGLAEYRRERDDEDGIE